VVGQTVAHYRILEQVGVGGMGVVYRAQDLKLGRDVALKFIGEATAGDAQAVERFIREARSAAALNHPNICTVYEIGEAEGRHYIAMEWLDGQTLQQHIGGRALPSAEAVAIGASIASALAGAHARGIVHRDIKPGNIMFTADGLVKVLDFGLAKPLASHHIARDADETCLGPHGLSLGGQARGTIAYMSPEQARGEDIDLRTDLFSLGVVLYEMATGRQAFRGTTTAVVFDGILNRTPEAPSHVNAAVPPEFEGIIARAIEKTREYRYQSADELARDLRHLLRQSDAAGAPVPSGDGPPSRRSKGVPGWNTLARPQWWRRWPIAVGAATVLAAGGVSLWSTPRTGTLSTGDVILVTDFLNSTGDPVFDGTLKQALEVKLGESAVLNVMPDQRVREALGYMRQPADAVVTAALGREICQREGAKALMTGEVARLGASYVITLTAETCASGDVLSREQVEVPRKEAVLAALGRSTNAMREKLGESLAAIGKSDTPIEQATTSSLEALKAFSLGDHMRMTGGDVQAISFYRQAVERDPDFAMAHARLGTVYGNVGETQLSEEHRRKAFALREKVSERERFYITAHYYTAVEKNLLRAAEIYELWKRTYPGDATPYINIGIIYADRGEDDRALASYREANRLDPRMTMPYLNAADILVKASRFDEARALLDRGLEATGGNAALHLKRYVVAAILDDHGAMATHANVLRGTDYEGELLAAQAAAAVFEGRIGDYRRLTQRVVGLLTTQGLTEQAAVTRYGVPVVDALYGFRDRSLSEARALAGQEHPPRADIGLAVAFALLGDSSRAEQARAVVRGQAKSSHDGMSAAEPNLVPAILALRRGRPRDAIDALETVDVRGHAGSSFGVWFAKGQAYLQLGEPSRAEKEFQRIVDARGQDPFDPTVPLAVRGVARARLAAGNRQGAAEAYTRLFTFWKDSDTDVPAIMSARAEFERLKAETKTAGVEAPRDGR
jgi:eukaryotic-like serine/threonine-protein kinase